jgi:uncharacterized RDD family membrane protein YckC
LPALDKLSIDTPEQVALDFTLASIGSRFLALALDTVIQVGATLVMILLGGLVAWTVDVTLVGKGPWVLAALVLGWFLIYSGYFAMFEATWNGQTPGKRVVGLRVISVTGRPISAYEAILRNVVRVADQLPGTYAVGILAIFITGRNQRLGDLAAGTVVVHEHSASRREIERSYDAPAGSVHHGATRLTPEEIAVIELFLHRRAELSDYGRSRSAAQISERMAGRLGVATRRDGERFLEELVAEYRVSGRYH